MLNKDQILAAQDLAFIEVEVPEWGGSVRLRSMTGADRDEYEQSLLAGRTPDKAVNLKNIRARLVAVCAVDEAGQRLFSESEVEQLGAKSARALDRLFEAASELNAVGAKEIDALGKPSAPTGGDASTSASPAN